MNPSTESILEGVNKIPAETVFVLPNNKNIIMAAQAAADQYVRCTKDSLTIAERTLAAAKRQADTLVQEATAQAQKLLADADAHLESSWSQFLLDDSAQQTKNGE